MRLKASSAFCFCTLIIIVDVSPWAVQIYAPRRWKATGGACLFFFCAVSATLSIVQTTLLSRRRPMWIGTCFLFLHFFNSRLSHTQIPPTSQGGLDYDLYDDAKMYMNKRWSFFFFFSLFGILGFDVFLRAARQIVSRLHRC